MTLPWAFLSASQSGRTDVRLPGPTIAFVAQDEELQTFTWWRNNARRCERRTLLCTTWACKAKKVVSSCHVVRLSQRTIVIVPLRSWPITHLVSTYPGQDRRFLNLIKFQKSERLTDPNLFNFYLPDLFIVFFSLDRMMLLCRAAPCSGYWKSPGRSSWTDQSRTAVDGWPVTTYSLTSASSLTSTQPLQHKRWKKEKNNLYIYLMSQRAQILPKQVPTMLPCTHVSKITFQKVENCMRLLCWSRTNK